MAEAQSAPEVGGDHFRSSAVMYTHAHPKLTEGSDVRVGTSMDQLYVQKFGQDTPIPSMQLSIEPVDQSGGCAYGYACVYTDTISWAAPDRAAADGARSAHGVRADVRRRRHAGAARAAPRHRSQHPRHAVRARWPACAARSDRPTGSGSISTPATSATSSSASRASKRATPSGETRELPGAPAGVPDSFDEHVKLMFDLQVLAFSSDTTRVFSFKFGRDGSGRVYPGSGVDRGFHNASHHGAAEERIRQFGEINKYHVSLLPYFLEKLQATMDGDANLLEKTLIIYGSPMANGNMHNHRNCPLILLGHGGGAPKAACTSRPPKDTPMANVMLTLLHRLGLDDLQTFGDSTGEFSFAAAGRRRSRRSRYEVRRCVMSGDRDLRLWRCWSLAAGLACAQRRFARVADAAMRGDAEAVRTLLRGGADVNAAQGDGMTALHWAALNGDLKTMNVLLLAGATTEPLTRVGAYTPLHLASSRGHAAVVARLLEAGSKARRVDGNRCAAAPSGGAGRQRASGQGAARPRRRRQRARQDARPDAAGLRGVAEIGSTR